jgi:hypothetical protein
MTALLLATQVAARPAVAADAPASHAGDAATAEALFREGSALLDAGNAVEACPKLADSHRLDPGGGTVLVLALCYEALGRWASAWTAFHEAIAFARRDGRADREQRATERLSSIEPRLSHLVVRVSAPIEAIGVERDGVAVPASAWGMRLPVDPGEHIVSASAPGRSAWSTRFRAAEGSADEVVVPELAPLPPPVARAAGTAPPPLDPAPPVAPRRDSNVPAAHHGRSTVGFVALGVGVAGLALGTWFGISALDDARAADDACPVTECTDPAAVARSQRATRSARVSTIAFAAGGVLSVAGAYLLLAPIGSGELAEASGGPTGARVLVGGSF